MRSKASRLKKDISAIVEMLKSEDPEEVKSGLKALNKADQYQLPKIPHDALFEFAEQWRLQAATLQEKIKSNDVLKEDIGRRRPFINTVYGYLKVAFILEQRRLPTAQEEARIKYQEADPFFATDLEHAEVIARSPAEEAYETAYAQLRTLPPSPIVERASNLPERAYAEPPPENAYRTLDKVYEQPAKAHMQPVEVVEDDDEEDAPGEYGRFGTDYISPEEAVGKPIGAQWGEYEDWKI